MLNIFDIFFDPRYVQAQKYVENVSNVEKNLDKALEKWTFPPKFPYCTLNLNHEYINIFIARIYLNKMRAINFSMQ